MPADSSGLGPVAVNLIAGLSCEEVAESLAHLAEGAVAVDAPTRAHVDACLRCQADVVQYRRLLRSLRALRSHVLVPAPGRLAEVLANLEDASERRAVRATLSGRRAAYIGGIAAAATATAAGAIVIAARNRRLRPTG